MAKNKINSGAIVAIPLNYGFGYMYAKVVNLCDFSEIDLSSMFHFVIYTNNYITNDVKDFDVKKFENSIPFTGGLYVMDLEPVVKKKIWLNVGEATLRSYEKIVPDFRGFGSKVFAVHKYEKDANSWNYFEKGSPIKRIRATYDEVKHIENSTCLSHDLIEKRLSMEFLYRNGKTIKDFYGLEDWEDLVVYNNMLYTIPFNEVPDRIKGKAMLW